MRLGGDQKAPTLLKYIKPKLKSKIPVIIFCNSTKTCDFIQIFLNQFNIKCITLHGEMPVKTRKGKFVDFQNGRSHILITTDTGARGLDTTYARDVINYEFPLISAEYIHR